MSAVAESMHLTGGVYAKGGRTFTSPALSNSYRAGASLSVSLEAHQCGKGQRPYISATAEVRAPRRRDVEAFGCLHDDILREWPEASVVVRCHLSDAVTGEPMHALANGIYWAAGARGGWGERYHGGGGSDGKPWRECLRILAEHLRVTEAEAEALCERVETACPEEWEAEYGRIVRARAFAREIDAMRPRWADEAAQAIAFIREHCSSDLRAEYDARLAAMYRPPVATPEVQP